MSIHVSSLTSQTPYVDTSLGSIRKVTAETLPSLKNLSIKKVLLAPGAIREPHWHTNANELTYCLRGNLLVSVLDTGNEFSTFTVDAGEMFHVEAGSLHHFENVGDTEAEVIVAFRHELPQDFALSASLGAMSDAVLGNTYDLESGVWSKLRRNVDPKTITAPKYLIQRRGEIEIPRTARWPNKHKFNVEEMSPPTWSELGTAHTARSQFWPALNDMSMYSLRVEDTAMREPHWHPRTGEMGYVVQGEARMSILDLEGQVDTYTLRPGDVYFVPAAYPHQIEVIGSKNIHFLIFFDQPMPQDVGYRNSATLLSRGLIASMLEVDEKDLPWFPHTPKDPLIVGKKNPLDPVNKSKPKI